MSFEDDPKGQRRSKADSEPKSPTNRTDKKTGAAARDSSRKRSLPASNIGDALKSAYDRTVHEDIPPEMLDLLGKLG